MSYPARRCPVDRSHQNTAQWSGERKAALRASCSARRSMNGAHRRASERFSLAVRHRFFWRCQKKWGREKCVSKGAAFGPRGRPGWTSSGCEGPTLALAVKRNGFWYIRPKGASLWLTPSRTQSLKWVMGLSPSPSRPDTAPRWPGHRDLDTPGTAGPGADRPRSPGRGAGRRR